MIPNSRFLFHNRIDDSRHHTVSSKHDPSRARDWDHLDSFFRPPSECVPGKDHVCVSCCQNIAVISLCLVFLDHSLLESLHEKQGRSLGADLLTCVCLGFLEFQICRVQRLFLIAWFSLVVTSIAPCSPSFHPLTGASSILLSSFCWLKTHVGCGLLLPQARCVNDLLHQLVKGLLHAQLGLCTALHE